MSRPKTISGSAGTLQVRVPRSGQLSLAGLGLRRVSKVVRKAGAYKLKVGLTTKAAGTLRARRRFSATVRVTFTPTGRKPSTARVRMTFIQPKATAKSARPERQR